MAERSLYAKVRVILDVATRAEAESPTELRLSVADEGHSEFLTHQYDDDIDDYVWRQSARAIARALQTALRLALLDEDCSISSAGRRALRSERAFGREIRAAVLRRLTIGGAPTQSLRRASTNLLSSNPPILPTAARLYENVAPQSLSRAEFVSLLNMLAAAGGAATEQRRVYLAFNE